MFTEQQRESLDFFNRHAHQWSDKADGLNPEIVNVVQQRNSFVLEVVLKHRPNIHVSLDVGCGTGELVRDIAKTGISAVGVDYAEKMISIAREKSQTEGGGNVTYHCSSIFDLNSNDGSYDLISANGFIEYISLEQLHTFLQICQKSLTPRGSLVLGSRNRLYNLFSLNDFTETEIRSGFVNDLLLEAIALARGVALQELCCIQTAPLQGTDSQHSDTGIQVNTRFQYTPAQLIQLLSHYGFQTVQLYPVHIHSVPQVFKTRYPQIHTTISNTLQTYAFDNTSLIPYASTFMLHAFKSVV